MIAKDNFEATLFEWPTVGRSKRRRDAGVWQEVKFIQRAQMF